MSIAPELTERSAGLLVDRFGREGVTAESIAEAGIASASAGFGTLDPAVGSEVGALLDGAYATLRAPDRARLGAYLDHARAGGVTAAESREGRRLFADALRNLDDARRARLASAYEKAIVAGLRYYAEAQARTRDAVAAAPLPPAGGHSAGMAVTVATPVADVQVGYAEPGATPGRLVAAPRLPSRGEEYWRAEAQRRQSRLVALEQELAALEAESQRLTFLPGNSSGQKGFGPPTPEPALVRAEEVKRRLPQVKLLVERARQSVLDLEHDAVHDNGLPGWVR